MATEYKFMFDRRFDEDEPPAPVEEDPSTVSVDGIPSISQLLDSLNQKLNQTKPDEQPEETKKDIPVSSDSVENTEKETDITEPAGQTDVAEPAGQTDITEPAGESIEDETNENESTEGNEDVPSPEPEEPAAVSEPSADKPEPPAPMPFSAPYPVYSEEQLKAAEEKAREEGRLSGLEEGRESAWQEAMVSLQKQNSDTLLSIDASLKNIFSSLEQSGQDACSAAVDFALAVCKKAVPALCATNAIGEIRALLKNNLHFLKDEPKISLRLNPFLADQIKPVLTDLVKKEAYSGKIAVIRDDALAVGDCRVEWKNGGMEKNVQDVLNHTEELIKLYNHTVPTDQPSGNQTGEEHHG